MMKIPSPTWSRRTLKDGAASHNYNEYFAIHEKIPEALVTDKPTVPPPTTVPSEGIDTRGPTRVRTTSPSSTDPVEEVFPGLIGGRVFFDSNDNGRYDGGDNGIANVLAWLFSCNGEFVANAKTSPEGFFRWKYLAWGNYVVTVQLPSGYVSATVGDGNKFGAVAGPVMRDADGRTVCFAIREGGPRSVELSFRIELAPTSSPTPRPSVHPSMSPSRSHWPTPRPSYAPNLPIPPSTMPSSWTPWPSHKPKLSAPPSTMRSSAMPSPSVASIASSLAPSNKQQPSFEYSQYPTRSGESVGPIESNRLRIILFGIDQVQNEAEWNDGMALYINRYFNSERNYAFDVNVDIIITKQTAKSNYLGEYIGNSALTRQMRKHTSVEIVYAQISTYKTIDPTFVDIAYILQEPFATTESRYDYISFLQLLSPGNYANLSSVSPVILPRQPPQRETFVNDGNKRIGLGLRIFFIIGGLVVLLLAVPFAFVIYRKRRRMAAESEEEDSEIREEKKESERSDGVSGPREVQSSQPLSESLTTATHTSLTRSSCSERVIEISIPPGRVGCMIDRSSRRGPYVCEIHEFSPLRDVLRLGDRIIAVDGDDARGMNATTVSKLLGSRSENDERRMTILREFSNDASVDESGESRSDDEDEESKTSKDPPGLVW